MTKEQLHVLQHALGVNEYGVSPKGCTPYYRDYYIGEDKTADELVSLGYMVKLAGNVATGGDFCYRVTDAGKKAIRDESPSPPKLTRSQIRYREYLDADGCLGETFREYLSNIQTQWYKDAKAGVHYSSLEDYV